MFKSVQTIDSPEFINLQPLDINPLMSSCEIKVFYLGRNRNQSYIDKDTALQMAKTLRGCPIVGWFKAEKDDFRDHGTALNISDGEFNITCNTRPYGFVAPDAKVWFQNFEEKDEFGNSVVRTYLMTTGYLWTGQYKECKRVVNEGRPHSMELDDETLDGHWAKDSKLNEEFFIINDATLSKLCILGNDVEPCFEGSSVTAPNVSKNFTKIDDTFKETLFSMIEDLKKYALKGGQPMDKVVTPEVERPVVEEVPVVEVQEPQTEEVPATTEPEMPPQEDTVAPVQEEEPQQNVAEDTPAPVETVEAPAEDITSEFQALKENYQALQQKFEELNTQYQTLITYKNQIESAKKDELINKFSTLTAEEKDNVIKNKDKYSYEQIEAELSVIYCKKQFALEAEEANASTKEETIEPQVIFNVNDSDETPVPDFVNALRRTKSKKY